MEVNSTLLANTSRLTTSFVRTLRYRVKLRDFVTSVANVTRSEGYILFNDALNTFYLRLYGVGHMVEDHSDSERQNPLLPHGLLFPINIKGSFICTIHGLCYTSRGALAGTINSSMCPPREGSIRRPIAS